MRTLFTLVVVLIPMGRLHAQPALSEPSEFPPSLPGPGATHTGADCFWLASGTIVPGDVDWVQVSIPVGTAQTVVDVDFPDAAASSRLLAWVSGVTVVADIDDNNRARDDFCGLGSSTTPLGSMRDSAADVGATAADAKINKAINRAEDRYEDQTSEIP